MESVASAGIFWLIETLKTRKRMRELGVDEAAMRSYKQELRSNSVRVIGDVTITESWVSHKLSFGVALFPLSGIAFFRKKCCAGRFGVRFYVALLLSDGKVYDLPYVFLEQQDEIMALLAERCPQANQRPWGT